MGKGNSTTTSSSTTGPTAQGQDVYNQILSMAGNAASQPYQSYSGELTAPVNAQQQTGIAGINGYANYSQPFVQQAAGLATGAANPLTASEVQNYENPYTANVVAATQAQFANQNQQQQAGLTGNTIAQGALGGNRAGVAASTLAGQQSAAQAPVIAGLENAGYTQALQTAQQQYQANPLAAANSIANFGIGGQNALLSGANSQVGAGTLEQQTSQAQDTAAYQQFENQQAFPYQQAAYYAGIASPVAGALGTVSNGSTTAPAPNPLNTIIGGLGTGVGALGATGAFGSSGWLAGLGLFSDERVKENIKRVGKTDDGQVIYKYNYKGDPVTHIGLLAQEVEKHKPEAVHEVNGVKTVNYDVATRAEGGLVRRASGGGYTSGVAGVPYAGAQGYIPTVSISARALGAAGFPQAAQTPQNQPVAGLSNIASAFKGSGSNSSATPDYGQTSNINIGGYSMPQFGNTVAVGDYQMPTIGFASGGGVAGFRGYADGGEVMSDADPDSVAAGRQYAQSSPYQIRPNQDGTHSVINVRTGQIHFTGSPSGAQNAQASLNYRSRGLGGGVHGYADGGTPMDDAEWPYGPNGAPASDFGDRFSGDPSSYTPQPGLASGLQTAGLGVAGVVNPDDPIRIDGSYNGPPVTAVTDPQGNVRGVLPTSQAVALKASDDDDSEGSGGPAPQPGLGGGPSPQSQPGLGGPPPALMQRPQVRSVSAPQASAEPQDGTKNFWPALMAAGLGMMASRSPFVGQAIGEGGLQGLKTFSDQQAADLKARQDDIKIQQEANRLQQEAQRAADEFALRASAQQAQQAAAPITADGKINPTYLDLKKKEADINQKDNWGPAGNVVASDGSLHPLWVNKVDHSAIDLVTQKPPLPSDRIQGLPGKGPDPSVVAHNVEGIASGRQPPTLTGLYGMSGAVRAGLEEKGFDLAKAQMEWKQAEKQIATLNGPQMTRFAGLAKSVDSTIDEVRELSKEMKLGGIPALNNVELAAYIKTAGNSPNGQLATRYMTAVNTLKEEFANLANGGYAPTEPAWKLADQQINGTYGVNQLGASLDEVQRLIRYRFNAIPGMAQSGPAAANRYTGQTGQQMPAAAPTAPASSTFQPQPGDQKQNGWWYRPNGNGGYTAVAPAP